MGLFLGNEIIQTRTYQDPNAPPKDSTLDYKNTFPITVFDAVRLDMDDEHSQTLREALQNIQEELAKRQQILPDLPPNYLVTYAGAPGRVSSIKISTDIPWESSRWRNDAIPTEQAVGKLLLKVGLVDEDGNAVIPGRIMWNNIIGRPKSYDTLGDNDDGFVDQRTITKELNAIKALVNGGGSDYTEILKQVRDGLNLHLEDYNNPHRITPDKIGAVKQIDFDEHLTAINPHNISVYTLGLENVDNTSDVDKPISIATQQALDDLLKLIKAVEGKADGIVVNDVVDIDYDRKTCKLNMVFEDGSSLGTFIPINDLVQNVRLDKANRTLILYKLSGETVNISMADLLYTVTGSNGSDILVSVTTNEKGERVIGAKIKPGSITMEMLSPDINTGGDGFVLTESCITTVHLANNSVTTEKISLGAVTGNTIADRAITGKNLFTSADPNMVLAITEAGEDASWTKVITQMIADQAITTELIHDEAVTNDKLAANSVSNDKIIDGNISGSKLVINPRFMGTPTIAQRPADGSCDDKVPDTKWVMERIDQFVFRSKNLGLEIVRPEHLFRAPGNKLVMISPVGGKPPEWGQLTEEYLEERGITSRTLADHIIEKRHLNDSIIGSQHIFTSDNADRVLAALTKDGHPVYTQITGGMIPPHLIGPEHLQERAFSLNHLPTSEENFRVIAVDVAGDTPQWMEIHSKLIGDRQIVPRHIFTSDVADRVMGIRTVNGNPEWLQVNEHMIAVDSINQDHLKDKSITSRHLNEGIIRPEHLGAESITGEKLAQRTVTGRELFTTPYPNRVLAVTDNPYDHPQWVKVTGEMLEDKSIDIGKLASADGGYKVMVTVIPGHSPKYAKIDSRYITEYSIEGSSLKRSLTLPGTPRVGTVPGVLSNNNEIPSTSWVRDYVGRALLDIATAAGIKVTVPRHSIDGDKLFTSDKVGVIGIEKAGENAKYLQIGTAHIKDHAVTSEKLADSINLNGLPTISQRPDASAADSAGTGKLIPDCQWVLDRIRDAVKVITGDDYYDDSEWTEMREIRVEEIWKTADEGEVDSDDPDEMTDAFIQLTWRTGGSGTLETTDPEEITSEAVEKAWNEGLSNINTSEDPLDGNDWVEMAASKVADHWENNGGEYVAAMPSELTEGQVTEEWKNGGTGDTDHFDGEISKETVELEWAGKGIDIGDEDHTPGAFPGTSTTSGQCTKPCTCDGTATSLDGREIVRHEHLAHRAVNGEKMFTSLEPNVVLGIRDPNTDASWGKITTPMVADGAITEDKIDPAFIAQLTKKKEEEEGYIHIPQKSIDASHIADRSITGKKIAREQQIPAYTTVEPQRDLEKKSLRNVIISHRSPKGGSNGDLWFQYY